MTDKNTSDLAPSDLNVDLLIVGGGPAGLGVARGYREAGGTGTVLLVGADEHPPYARPPLTKEYLRGETDADSLPLAEPEWYTDNAIDLRLGTPATELDVDRRQVVVSDGTVIGYERLALATGSSPNPLPVPGGDLPGVIYVRDRNSGEALRGIAQLGRNVVVIGSGFIGCEAAASLARRGASVVLVTDEELPHAARLGAEAGARIRDWLVDAGVVLVLGDGVASLTHTDDEGWRVDLVSGRILSRRGGGQRERRAAERRPRRRSGSADRERRGGDRSRPANLGPPHLGRRRHRVRAQPGRRPAVAGRALGRGRDRWARSPGPTSPGRTGGGRQLRVSGRVSATMSSSTRRGVTATSAPSWWKVPQGWAVWYAVDGSVVGVLTSDWDAEYERGQELIERHADLSEALERREGAA